MSEKSAHNSADEDMKEMEAKLDGISDTKRAFFMGNALVVGVIEKIGQSLIKQIENAKTTLQ